MNIEYGNPMKNFGTHSYD